MYKVSIKQFADFSADVYNETTFYQKSRLLKTQWLAISIPESLALPYEKAFFARLYIKKINNKNVAAVVAYRGTLVDKIENDIDDIRIGLKKIPTSYTSAERFYCHANQYAKKKFGLGVKLTGHSLGGALAQLVAIKAAAHPQTVAFNSPGIGDLNTIDPDGSYPYLHNINSKKGLINKFNHTVGSVDEIKIESGDTAKTIANTLALLPGLKIIGGASKLLSYYQKHQISNVISTLNEEPALANQRY